MVDITVAETEELQRNYVNEKKKKRVNSMVKPK
jgi:hypothetical protein